HYAGVQIVCAADVGRGKWQHLAFVYDQDRATCFFDGQLIDSAQVESIDRQPLPDLQQPEDREHEHRDFKSLDAEQRRKLRFNVAIGTNRQGKNAMLGLIDELRISQVARYAGPFTPKSCSQNYGERAPTPAEANGPPLLFPAKVVSAPLEFGTRKHVFVDDALLAEKSNLSISLNQPYNKRPIGTDFEIRKSSWRPSVMDVGGQVYLIIPEGYGSEQGKTFLATSDDGIHFSMRKPILTETPLYGAFFHDLNPSVPATEKYKVNAFVANRGMFFYTSGDGVHWRRNEVLQLPLRSGGGGESFWDDQRGRYASYIKRDSSFNTDDCPRVRGRVAIGFWTKEILKPWPFRRRSEPYFEGYPFPAVTCEGPVSFDVSTAGEVYRTRAIKYPWAPDVYLAFVWRFSGDDGEDRHIDLGVSRNGEDWKFFGDHWYIPPGSREEELSLYGLIRRGNEIWQYIDEGGAHGGDEQRKYYRYTQRLDGFASLDAKSNVGTATTRPLLFEGDRLSINVKVDGELQVGFTDADGKDLPAYSVADSDLIRCDSVERIVTWKGKADVAALANRPIRLKFRMRDAKLFAFEFKYGPQTVQESSP
ncbi:MAG: hypothetical protein ACR2NM_10375, partial [Bythopirellula sp.]